jgi:hypothetical protein
MSGPRETKSKPPSVVNKMYTAFEVAGACEASAMHASMPKNGALVPFSHGVQRCCRKDLKVPFKHGRQTPRVCAA